MVARSAFAANAVGRGRTASLSATVLVVLATCARVRLASAQAAPAGALIRGDLDAQWMSTTHDCTCECCMPGNCKDGLKTYIESVGSAAACTDTMCRSKYSDCPDSGAHTASGGDPGMVIATYNDCTCQCCKPDECGTNGSGLKAYTYHAESQAKCVPDQCASRFYGCPNSGGQPSSQTSAVVALYSDCMCACSMDPPAVLYSRFFAVSTHATSVTRKVKAPHSLHFDECLRASR
jgi:hypothetical protein